MNAQERREESRRVIRSRENAKKLSKPYMNVVIKKLDGSRLLGKMATMPSLIGNYWFADIDVGTGTNLSVNCLQIEPA